MPDWLADADRTLLLLLAAATVAGLVAWLITRRRSWLVFSAVSGGVLAVLLLADRLFESDRELIGGRLQAMAASVGRRDVPAVFADIAESFRYGPATDKKSFRQFCESAMHNRGVRELVIWDVTILSYDATAQTADVTFRFKVRADALSGYGQEGFYLCKARFVREGDGHWRLQTFNVYPPTGLDPPLFVPGLG